MLAAADSSRLGTVVRTYQRAAAASWFGVLFRRLAKIGSSLAIMKLCCRVTRACEGCPCSMAPQAAVPRYATGGGERRSGGTALGVHGALGGDHRVIRGLGVQARRLLAVRGHLGVGDALLSGIKQNSIGWCVAAVGALLKRAGHNPSCSLAAHSCEAGASG